MQVIHTSYIKRLADKTGKTYRDLESLWKKFEREVEHERMYDPNKFSHLKSKDGSIAQEIAKRFEDHLTFPEQTEAEDQIEEITDAEEEVMADEIGDEIADDTEEAVDEVFDEEIDIQEELDNEDETQDEESISEEIEDVKSDEKEKSEPEISESDFEDFESFDEE